MLGAPCLGGEGADPRWFYRLESSTDSVITALSKDGVLSWSDAASQGSYVVYQASNLTEDAWSPLSRGDFTNSLWSIRVYEENTPEGMSFIPGGRFQMGDSLSDPRLVLARPVHTVYVDPFIIDRREVSNERIRSVLQWAYDRGLVSVTTDAVLNAEGATNVLMALNKFNSDISFTNDVFAVKPGRTNFPCVWISWYGAVAFCNYRSSMEAREQCYDLSAWTCDFTRKGYRLPTEAEWEFAARGGYDGLRFPWGDTNVIDHSRANYKSDTNNWYDVSPTRGYHPEYAALQPKSNPVDRFHPNNYRLYDMAGNSWEWVWDRYDRYGEGTLWNPTGPTSGTDRIFRGGSWYTTAERVTCAARYRAAPASVFSDYGFRAVLPCSAVE
jgi:formylglycine-generating enzyme